VVFLIVSWSFTSGFDSLDNVESLLFPPPFCIHIFSIEYIDKRSQVLRVSLGYLSVLFTNDGSSSISHRTFLQLFLGWEGIGSASYSTDRFLGTLESIAVKAAIKAVIMKSYW
jgi:NADH:ubiquinone oxidoreductase subunit 5 (subunit L)/multisubunit Na+/H+ antiporter MnhA subunit